MSDIPLAEAIREMRRQIVLATVEGQREEVRFRLGPIELELQVQLEKSAEAEAGIKAWVLSAGSSGKVSSAQTHRIKLTLDPVTDAGGDVVVRRDR
jgi:hypothetical protein